MNNSAFCCSLFAETFRIQVDLTLQCFALYDIYYMSFFWSIVNERVSEWVSENVTSREAIASKKKIELYFQNQSWLSTEVGPKILLNHTPT